MLERYDSIYRVSIVTEKEYLVGWDGRDWAAAMVATSHVDDGGERDQEISASCVSMRCSSALQRAKKVLKMSKNVLIN